MIQIFYYFPILTKDFRDFWISVKLKRPAVVRLTKLTSKLDLLNNLLKKMLFLYKFRFNIAISLSLNLWMCAYVGEADTNREKCERSRKTNQEAKKRRIRVIEIESRSWREWQAVIACMNTNMISPSLWYFNNCIRKD